MNNIFERVDQKDYFGRIFRIYALLCCVVIILLIYDVFINVVSGNYLSFLAVTGWVLALLMVCNGYKTEKAFKNG